MNCKQHAFTFISMKKIILDTDLDTDCDDAGALALLHNLESRGACRIAAVICNAPVKYASLYARIVNAYYERPYLATGQPKHAGIDSFDLYFKHRKSCKAAGVLYNEVIVHQYAHLLKQSPATEDAVTLYRKTLANAHDKSIDICAIGLLNVLGDLISSKPCRYSKLNGIELVRCKVGKLVVMGKGHFPTGKDTFNWRMAPFSAANVLNQWPGKIIINPLGDNIMTGRKLMLCKDKNPITDAYKLFLKQGDCRPSWDPIAVLYTVLEDKKLFRLREGFSLTYNPADGIHHWEQSSKSRMYLLETNTTTKTLTSVIDDLLVPRICVS
jgi:inosine-uridine nucleoside N-ribohydrolase